MKAESTVMVQVRDLVKDFRPGFGLRRKRVLHGVSLEVGEGEVFGFVGPNGAGKTTTLKILMGLVRPTSGEAMILGCEVHETAFRKQIGFLPENPYFYDYLTGREILHFYAGLSGVSKRAQRERVGELLQWVRLEHAADARLRTYSKGMLQRIGIAQALVHDPRVIFLDEPMSGLDPIGRKEIRDIILRLKSEGKTVLMNTHILSDVEMICDRVAIIVKGRIVHQGRPDAFIAEEAPPVEIVLSGMPAAAAEDLRQDLDAELRPHGDRVELRVADKDVNVVLERALAERAQVVAVTPHRASLEDTFLSAVRAGGDSE